MDFLRQVKECKQNLNKRSSRKQTREFSWLCAKIGFDTATSPRALRIRDIFFCISLTLSRTDASSWSSNSRASSFAVFALSDKNWQKYVTYLVLRIIINQKIYNWTIHARFLSRLHGFFFPSTSWLSFHRMIRNICVLGVGTKKKITTDWVRAKQYH